MPGTKLPPATGGWDAMPCTITDTDLSARLAAALASGVSIIMGGPVDFVSMICPVSAELRRGKRVYRVAGNSETEVLNMVLDEWEATRRRGPKASA